LRSPIARLCRFKHRRWPVCKGEAGNALFNMFLLGHTWF
jgi:hypothetical protein